MRIYIIILGFGLLQPAIGFAQSLDLVGQYGISSSDIAVNGDYAYMLAGYPNLMAVFDISDPSNPTIIGGYHGGSGGYRALVAQGNYVYLSGQYSFEIIDVSDPSNPDSIASLPLSGNQLGGGYGVAIEGNYAYVDDCETGLRIIDISNRYNPIQVSQIAIPGGT